MEHSPTGLPGRIPVQPLTAGLITAVVGFSSSFALVLTGLRGVGADSEQAVSGLLLLCLSMGALAIWLGLRHRQPISIAWSTPGAALLVGAGRPTGGYAAAVGAFMVCGLLLAVTGLWPRLSRLVAAIPTGLATGLLAGVLLPLCLAPVQSAFHLPGLTLPVIVVWAVLLRLARRWATPGALIALLVVLAVRTPLHLGSAGNLLPRLSLTTPTFGWSALVSIALPLYVITMASQNIPGLALLRHFGYEPPVRHVLTATGLSTVATAFGGGYTVNLAAITAALAAGPDAHPDRGRRWIASVTAGVCYILLGLTAGVSAVLLTQAPPQLVEAIAGLALLPTLGSALSSALAEEKGREAAVLTFVVAASGVSAYGIGAPVWALAAGLVLRALL
ncbi:benzoate/H(+) symporter BenE family transporter [Streptacidiphilus neutrinimicus]|uniref:benzoate/H(+) symporter BenE family transporter n=1 Tax=Streptacidiphilus neutrinimicus TaxID=105420 RepID=UPI0005A7307C|nr:benzoate/H(+) symporter BenE family transporter [Streptacidiphilus neutrinimicus]